MKQLSILTLTMLALTGFMATTVQAGSAHFLKASASVDPKTGEYCVTFKEAGLGNTAITYVLQAGTEQFTFQCFTKSNNTPQGDPNGQTFSDASTSTTILPHNGQVTGTLCLDPQQGTADCQGGGLVLKLTAVDYENVTLTDTTNGAQISLPTLSADNLAIKF
jgi:hypothetical protein